MTDSTTDYAQWIGRREITEDDLGLAPALAAAAMLDDTMTRFEKGSSLPALWHWFYFLPRAPQALLDVCLLYTSPSPRDRTRSRMPSSA